MFLFYPQPNRGGFPWPYIHLIGRGSLWLLGEIACPPGELLSDATARYGQSHMFLSSAVIGVVAVHLLRTTGLLRFIPEQLDLIHLLASLK